MTPTAHRFLVTSSAWPAGFLAALFAANAGFSAPPPAAERVDYGYTFAPPHRITVGRPGASVKTLLDVEPGVLTISWTYDDLRGIPLAVWKAPRIAWRVKLTASVDGEQVKQSTWTRARSGAPLLVNEYAAGGASVLLEVVGGEPGAIGRISLRSTDGRPHRIALRAEVLGGWVAHNHSWIEPGVDADALLAMQQERPDRVLLLLTGGQTAAPQKKAVTMEWRVDGASPASGWLLRPHEAYQGALPALRRQSWSEEFSRAMAEWDALLASGARFDIPDDGVAHALRASLSDLYIMREPLAKGYTGAVCGTEVYRSTNPFEPSLVAIALDQSGHHAAAAEGMRVHLDMQAEDGNWNDPQGWAHHMWGGAGMKAWAAMEHFRLTGDRDYLAAVYPRLLKNSRWQAAQRARAGTDGLMPRGMGDGGLMRGDDHFGVFYPHNFLAVLADRLAAEAAGLLGRANEAAELRRNYETALSAVKASLERGAIAEDGLRWIPGGPGLTTGSRWGALYALTPAAILEPRHPLIEGTLRKIEATLSPGGQPLHTGWMANGTWPAISLDNLAEAHLLRNEGDASAAYLYSTLNHATPLTTWCEERGLEPQTTKTSGDRHHLWTPLAVVRLLRDTLVMEQAGELHLAIGTARSWLSPGRHVGVERAPTHFGPVTYRIAASPDSLRAEVDPPMRTQPKAIILHLREVGRRTPRAVRINGKPASFDASCECVTLPAGQGRAVVEATY
jgi:hypothetical protein